MRVGGQYSARMEAVDGSFGFDFVALYTKINRNHSFTYHFCGRTATVTFQKRKGKTKVIITFDPETENDIELQRSGWQSILNNFKRYTENH